MGQRGEGGRTTVQCPQCSVLPMVCQTCTCCVSVAPHIRHEARLFKIQLQCRNPLAGSGCTLSCCSAFHANRRPLFAVLVAAPCSSITCASLSLFEKHKSVCRKGGIRSWASWAPRWAPASSSASTAAPRPVLATRSRCGSRTWPATSAWAKHVRCPRSLATRLSHSWRHSQYLTPASCGRQRAPEGSERRKAGRGWVVVGCILMWTTEVPLCCQAAASYPVQPRICCFLSDARC